MAQTKITSPGICKYCNGEFDKAKMTGHLKHCKQRAASIKQADAEGAEKTRIFQILVEGKYLPMYWMHLEMPAKARLYELDDFLRAVWLECCDHLSAFNIGNISFSSPEPEFDLGSISIIGAPDSAEQQIVEEEVEEVDEEEEDDEDDEEEDNGLTLGEEVALLEKSAQAFVDRITEKFPNGLLKASEKKIAAVIHQMLLEAGNTTPAQLETPEMQNEIATNATMIKYGYFVSSVKRGIGEQDMDYRLSKVLKVGTKFSHTYDFGSSTYLSLRVIGEREGVMTGEDETVQVMAVNEPPVIPCRECGKPATRVIPGYASVEYGALCATCEIKGEDAEYYSNEDMLPIVNSPRVGVCGYTGDEYSEWEMEDEEDNSEE